MSLMYDVSWLEENFSSSLSNRKLLQNPKPTILLRLMGFASVPFPEAVDLCPALEDKEDFQPLTQQMGIISIHLQEKSKHIEKFVEELIHIMFIVRIFLLV